MYLRRSGNSTLFQIRTGRLVHTQTIKSDPVCTSHKNYLKNNIFQNDKKMPYIPAWKLCTNLRLSYLESVEHLGIENVILRNGSFPKTKFRL